MTGKPVIDTAVGSIKGSVQSITASAQSIVFPLGNTGIALLQLAGNAVGHNSVFEGTLNGTDWFSIPAVRTDTFALLTATGVVAAPLSYGLWLFAQGCAAFRIRSTAHGSGTATWTASFLEEVTLPPLAALAATISGNPVLGAAASTVIGKVTIDAGTTTTTGVALKRVTAAAVSGVLKASGGRFYGGNLTNHNAATRYVHIYNKTTAPTLGTDTPVLTIGIPPGQTVSLVDIIGAAFATGMAWAVTTDNIAIPTTAGAAGDISGTFRSV